VAAVDIATLKERLLARLETAGTAGLPASRLIRSPKTKAGQLARKALTELEREGRIGNLGTARLTRYVVREHYRPLEMAYEHIQARTRTEGPRLLVKSELIKGLRGALKDGFARALDLLVKEGILLRLKRGNSVFYLDIRTVVPASPEATPTAPTIDRARLDAAYRRTVSRTFLPDVLIADLQQALNAPLDELHQLLRSESAAGRAVVSLGDWSLASAEARAAALEVDGRPHLRVRLI